MSPLAPQVLARAVAISDEAVDVGYRHLEIEPPYTPSVSEHHRDHGSRSRATPGDQLFDKGKTPPPIGPGVSERDGDRPNESVGGDGADRTTARGRVHVVGTAHVSERSVDAVEEAIATHDPDVVAVELDEDRYRQLQGEAPEDLRAEDLLRGNTVYQFLAYWLLSYVQSRLGDRFDIEPGADMLAAVEAAEERGARIELVDRDIQTTIQRFWARMTVGEKLRMASGLLFGAVNGATIGVTLGLLVGLVAGPALGLFGGAVGVGGELLGRAAAGGLLALLVGGAVWRLVDVLVGPDSGLVAGVLAGSVGLLAGFGLGAAGEGVTAALGGTAVTAAGSLTLGLLAGLAVGGLVGIVLHLAGVGTGVEDEEFDIEMLTDTDAVSAMIAEFRRFSPGGAEALIDERDAYIAHHLVELRDAGNEVVAVVGAGHQEGIEAYLANPDRLPPLHSITGVEQGRGIPVGTIVGGLASLGVVVAVVLLVVAGVRERFLLKLFGAWFLINAVFAVGLARAAGARWVSSLVAGSVAWLTSINPLLAPGWFAGYVELRYTPVNVSDVTRLNELLGDEDRPIRAVVADMFEVPLFRLIMIVAMTNVGSFVASLLFVAYVLPALAADLGGVDGVARLMVTGAEESARWIWGQVA